MCGDQGESATVPSLGERRLFALQARLDQLHSKTLELGKLAAHIGQMCWMCQMLMLGISSEADLPELVTRIDDRRIGNRFRHTDLRAAAPILG